MANTEWAIEAFVWQLYGPATVVTGVSDLRWRLFTKKQSEVQNLPLTQGELSTSCHHNNESSSSSIHYTPAQMWLRKGQIPVQLWGGGRHECACCTQALEFCYAYYVLITLMYNGSLSQRWVEYILLIIKNTLFEQQSWLFMYILYDNAK